MLPTARADAPTVFAIRYSVAEAEGGPVVTRAWLDEQITRANEIFAPARIAFRRGSLERLTPPAGAEPAWPADLVTRADRHRLAPLAAEEVIDVFVVRSLGDVDEPGQHIRGVHWRSRRAGAPNHYAILASIAGSTVLAHELGHFFGNPHSDVPGNIMSYARGEGPPFFDDVQLRRIRAHAQRFVASGELVAR